MKRKFLKSAVVLLAAFGALFVAVSPDDFREFDAAYIQREMLKESAESQAPVRHPQPVHFSPAIALNQSRYAPSPAAITPSPTLSAFSTCILRC
jgi:hypothetical protein